jgi:spermidine synthase
MKFLLLLVCFFLSGFSALLYETAWTREFAFVFGTSELAVAAVLAAYMAGLATGAALASRIAPRIRRPVLVYGVVELLIALAALAVPLGVRAVSAAYLGVLGGLPELPADLSLANALVHLAGAFLVLLPCTALMGATLPLLARHSVRSDEQVGPRVGLLYAVNTAGAIGGTLVAAFVLLPALGLRQTDYVGVATNALVFLAAAALSRTAPAPVGVADRTGPRGRHWILPILALSGAASFVYEVLWTRILGYLLGASTAAFASMLASFLLGIALGSAAAARLARSRDAAALGFALAQLGAALFAWLGFQAADHVPELGVWLGASINALAPGALLSVVLLLPLTCCIGATFPFAVRLLARGAEDAGVASARVYAWNTVGSILGAIGAGFLLLPTLGFEGTLVASAGVNLALAATVALLARPRRSALASLAVAGAFVLFLLPNPRPERLLRTSVLSSEPFRGEIAYLGVGRSGTVALIEGSTGWRLTNNGLPESEIDRPGTPPHGFTAVRWLSLLPVAARPETQRLLVIGLGGGTTVGAVPRTVREIDVIELEPEIVAALRTIPARADGDPLGDPRVRVRLGDARGALWLTDARYDAIVSQPSHPWTSGASHLYTREFFELAKSRLEPDGVFVQWIGAAFMDEPLLRSILASLRGVFEHVEAYRPVRPALVFAASDAPLEVRSNAPRAIEAAPEAFAREGLHRVEDLVAAWVLDDAGSARLARGAAPNTDDDNRLATERRAIGGGRFDWADELLGEVDPLPAVAAELDALALAQRLGEMGQADRVARIVDALGPTEGEVIRGWRARSQGRPEAARAHFTLALAADAGHEDADLLAAARLGIALVAEGPDAHALSPRERALVEASRLQRGGELATIAPLDPELARFEPGELAHPYAARLRAAWRLASGEASRADEAMVILDELGVRQFRPELLLMRARAAVLAGRHDAAWATLAKLASDLPPGPRSGALAGRALVLAREIGTPAPHPSILPDLERIRRRRAR